MRIRIRHTDRLDDRRPPVEMERLRLRGLRGRPILPISYWEGETLRSSVL
jgi:hypothetical protein